MSTEQTERRGICGGCRQEYDYDKQEAWCPHPVKAIKEQTPTEQLRERMNGILHQYIIRNLDETIIIKGGWVTDQILQACKEAGLKFVLPVITSDPEIGNERIEEIELG